MAAVDLGARIAQRHLPGHVGINVAAFAARYL